MVENGVDKATWDKTFKSFDVNANIVTADTLFKNYQLDGVPALIVNGKYVVKGDSAEALRVVNKLLEENRKIGIYDINDYWLDIGQPEDFHKAHIDYIKVFNKGQTNDK
jgi:NDP-sugar pyrophosphorylase family protein